MSRCSPDGAAGHRHRLAHPSISTSIVKKRTSMFSQPVGIAVLSFLFSAAILVADQQLNPLFFSRQGLKTISLSASTRCRHPRFLSHCRPSGEGVEKLCRRFVKRKGRFSSLCAQTATASLHLDKQRDHLKRRRSAHPCTSTQLQLRTAGPMPPDRLPRRHVVDARGIQTVVDGGRES